MKEGFALHVVGGYSPNAVLENESTIKKTKNFEITAKYSKPTLRS